MDLQRFRKSISDLNVKDTEQQAYYSMLSIIEGEDGRMQLNLVLKELLRGNCCMTAWPASLNH
jgi:hypothetical protein